MIQFTTELKEEMECRIRTIESDERDILKRTSLTLKMLEELLQRLKKYIVEYTFTDEQEEILFFKEIKPRFFCNLLFYLKVFNLEMNRPMGSSETQASYFSRELDHISEYIGKRLDFYRYYRSGATHRDHYYFRRGVINLEEQYIDGFRFERDSLFSSSCDFTVAKIQSFDLLQVYLREEQERIVQDKPRLNDNPLKQIDVVPWTDKKAGLIEIIYSLDALGCFDNGELSLRKLQEFIEQHFDVKLENIARAFNDIKLRHNPTMFLDRMKDALLKRIEEADNRSGNHYAHNSAARYK